MQDVQTTNDDEQVKIELLSRWKLEAESKVDANDRQREK